MHRGGPHPSRRAEKIVIPGRRAVASPEPMNTGRARLAPPVFMGSRVRGNDGRQASFEARPRRSSG